MQPTDSTTGASPVGLVEVCISYSGLITFSRESSLQLSHFEDTNNDGTPDTWVNRTTSLDVNKHVICATVSALSPFAIFQSDMLPVGLQPPLRALVAQGEAVPLPSNAFKLGSTIPLKLTTDRGGRYVTDKCERTSAPDRWVSKKR